MSKWSRVVVPLAVLAFLCGFAWVVLKPREPSYNGKTLTEWIDDLDSKESLGREEAAEAIHHIGTNALPRLLVMIRDGEPGTFQRILAKLPPREAKWLRYDPVGALLEREGREMLALKGIRILGSSAAPAVPALIKLMDGGDVEVQPVAIWCLAGLGAAASPAVPSLIRHMSDGSSVSFEFAKNALGVLHICPNVVVPALIADLRNPGNATPFVTIAALGQYGQQATDAVPVILPFLTNSVEIMRRQATNALLRIDPRAAAKAGVKIPESLPASVSF
jgi:HEAT repeat protein